MPAPLSLRRCSGFRAAALFVFLARSAGAGIVAADFSSAAHHLLNGLIFARSGHAGFFQFATLAALECFLQFVYGGSKVARSAAVSVATGQLRLRFYGFAGSFEDLHQVQIADRVFPATLHARFEHVEGLALVFHQRIVLAVTAQADALSQE